jgi:hypothetical protein
MDWREKVDRRDKEDRREQVDRRDKEDRKEGDG